MLNFRKNKSFAIDLGNNNTLLTDDQQILYSQASYIVFDEEKKLVNAFGDAAYDIFEKNHNRLKPVKPMRWGVIADYDSASTMINKIVGKVYQRNWFNPFDQVICGACDNSPCLCSDKDRF